MAKKRKFYDVWKNYDDSIRALHLESVEQRAQHSRQERIFSYLNRIPFILLAALLTTLTFQCLINPNKLFNSGINGVIQVIVNYVLKKNCIGQQNFTIFYYLFVLIFNLFAVSAAYFFNPYSLEVNSTAIIYIAFQLVLSSLFRYCSVQKYLFSRFSAESWRKLSASNQLGLTLPYYIVIAILSSVIHTYGYSLVYRAKSTPGGLEIVSSTLAQNKKRKISVSYLNKVFAVSVVVFITVFNFLFVNDNLFLKKRELVDTLNEIFIEENGQEKISSDEQLSQFIEEKLQSKVQNFEDRKTLEILKNWSGDRHLDKLINQEKFPENLKIPEGPQVYLQPNDFVLERFLEVHSNSKNFLEQHQQKSTASEEQKVLNNEICEYIGYLEERIGEIKQNTYKKNTLDYFRYVTNDEKFLASLVYIFLSSYLIDQIFPKSKLISLNALLNSNAELSRMIEILKLYEPRYSKIFFWDGNLEKEQYVLNCTMKKWDYQLISNRLQKIGKISITPLDESN